jgi:hypothetical protein
MTCRWTVVDHDPLRVSRGRLAVVEPALFERDVFELAAPIQSPLNIMCVQYVITLAFGGTLDRRCHFKYVSFKQSWLYHCQTSTAYR